jgi:hypothetical protein
MVVVDAVVADKSVVVSFRILRAKVQDSNITYRITKQEKIMIAV